jgi:hypothetical protein
MGTVVIKDVSGHVHSSAQSGNYVALPKRPLCVTGSLRLLKIASRISCTPTAGKRAIRSEALRSLLFLLHQISSTTHTEPAQSITSTIYLLPSSTMMLLTLFTTFFAMAAAAPAPYFDGNPGEYVHIQFYQGAKCTNADSGQLSISDTGCHSFSADGLRVIDKHPNLRFDARKLSKSLFRTLKC